MSSTNKTTNYQLSQFVGTDIPSILNDYNGDMRKIDTAIKEVAIAGGDSATAIAELQSTTGRLSTEVGGINATVNSISGRVISIEDKIPANASASNKLITAEDIPEIPSIEGLEQSVANLQTNVGELQEEVSDMGGDVKAIQLCVPATASESNKFATMADIGGGEPTVLYESASEETWVQACNNGLGDILENLTIDELAKVKILTNDTREGVGHAGQCSKSALYLLAVDFVGVCPEVSSIRYRCFNYIHSTSSPATASLYEWTLSDTGLSENTDVSNSYTATFKVVM